MKDEDYENQEVLKILKRLSEGEYSYQEAYELMELYTL